MTTSKEMKAPYMSMMRTKTLLLAGIACAPLAFANPSHALVATATLTQTHAVAPQALTLIAADQKAQDSAQKFVSHVADEGIAFLSNKDMSMEQRKKDFKKLLQRNFDMRTIARFALGRHWRSANKKQRDEYMDLFEKMVLNVYARRFSEYSGQTVEVTDARPEGKNDVLVHSTIVSPNNNQNVKVDWRIRNKGGKNKIIDIIVEGVSMSVTQRSDFSSVIQRGGGDIEVLLGHLRKQ